MMVDIAKFFQNLVRTSVRAGSKRYFELVYTSVQVHLKKLLVLNRRKIEQKRKEVAERKQSLRTK
jgi:hypothetical protein